MTYIASALARAGRGWQGEDLDLAAIGDLDELSDRLRELGAPAVCFLEEDDEYVAVVRVDGDRDPRIFVSDSRVLAAAGMAGRLLAESVDVADPVEEEQDDDDEEESRRPELEPAGDAALLADLGVDAGRLLELCGEEGMLPSDVIFAVAESMGAGDVLEAVRGV